MSGVIRRGKGTSIGKYQAGKSTDGPSWISTDSITLTMKDVIGKATKPELKPIKAKHIRWVVMKSCGPEGVSEFCGHVTNSFLKKDNVSHWKYLILMHSVLQNRPTATLAALQQIRSVLELYKNRHSAFQGRNIEEMPNSDVSVLKLIKYSNLLFMKLDFHYTNPNIPGNLDMQPDAFALMVDMVCAEYLLEMLKGMLEYWKVMVEFLSELLEDVTVVKYPSDELKCKFQPFIFCIAEAKQLYRLSRNTLYKFQSDVRTTNKDREDAMFLAILESYNVINAKVDTLDKRLIQMCDDLERETCNKAELKLGQRQQTQKILKSMPSKSAGLSSIAIAKNPSHPSKDLSHLEQTYLSRIGHRQKTAGIDDDFSRAINLSREEPTFQPKSAVLQTLETSLPTCPSAPAQENEIIEILRMRVHELHAQNELMTRNATFLTMQNTDLAAKYEALALENASLENELKQLKITSGRQFCQLYAAVRQKDELIKKYTNNVD